MCTNLVKIEATIDYRKSIIVVYMVYLYYWAAFGSSWQAAFGGVH